MRKTAVSIGLVWLLGACGGDAAAPESPEVPDAAVDFSAERARLACERDQVALRETFRSHWESCSKDDDCTVAKLDAGCASHFLCATAFNVTSDRAALDREARSLAATFSAKCGCAEADCAPISAEHAKCDVAAGFCVVTSQP